MDEFILEEKKNWEEHITLEKYIEYTEKEGYIDTGAYEYEFYYILENLKKLNNLQSKIGKVKGSNKNE